MVSGADFGTICTWFLFVFRCNYVTILHRFRDITILQHTLILVTLRSPSARIDLTWLTYFDWVVHMYPLGNGPAYSGPIRWGLFITGSLLYGWSIYLTSFVFQWNGKWNIERPFSHSIYTNFWTVLVQFSSICVMWMNFTEPLILPLEAGRLSWLRHCSKGAQPVSKAVYCSSCCGKYDCLWCDSISHIIVRHAPLDHSDVRLQLTVHHGP